MRRLATLSALLLVFLAACASSLPDPRVTYHGGSCTYEGPTVFDTDEEVTFTVVNKSETTEVAFGLVSFSEPVTPEEIFELGILEAGGEIVWLVQAYEIGKQYGLVQTVNIASLHGLNCWDQSLSSDDTHQDFTTILTFED